ncbi:hypothetical protein GCM10010398_23160 [Streptomyces fimbriatus]
MIHAKGQAGSKEQSTRVGAVPFVMPPNLCGARHGVLAHLGGSSSGQFPCPAPASALDGGVPGGVPLRRG